MRRIYDSKFHSLLARLENGRVSAEVCDAYVDDYYRDLALTAASSGSTFRVMLCNAEPDTYTEATSTFAIGNKTSPSLSVVAGTPNGRAAQCVSFANGVVTIQDTAAYWAVVDDTNSRLVSAGALSSPQTVYTANPWTLPTFQYVRMAAA
jgi:hypothetical protein